MGGGRGSVREGAFFVRLPGSYPRADVALPRADVASRTCPHMNASSKMLPSSSSVRDDAVAALMNASSVRPSSSVRDDAVAALALGAPASLGARLRFGASDKEPASGSCASGPAPLGESPRF